MSRIALTSILWIVLVGSTAAVRALDPHVDPARLPAGCPACHRGHGTPRSPMLPAPQSRVCLACHESQGKSDLAVLGGTLAPGARPTLLSSSLAQTFVHPLSEEAFSTHEPGVVTCTSCHSPHRAMSASRSAGVGVRKLSTRDPAQLEFELCESCHGGPGATARNPRDVSGLLYPNNRSYHPVEAPSGEGSPSVLPSLAGKEINCTDCHGNSDPAGARGPHGSAVRFILRSDYTTMDGNPESASVYALCYGCHDRDAVLNGTTFPGHRLHVVEERTSCATCHDPHGSTDNRALIRLSGETVPAGVAPSATADHLGFESGARGSGACYLSCHGYDHAPEVYGGHLSRSVPSRVPEPVRRPRPTTPPRR